MCIASWNVGLNKIAKSLASAITHKIADDIANIFAHSTTNEIASNVVDLLTDNFDSDRFNNFARHLTISIHR